MKSHACTILMVCIMLSGCSGIEPDPPVPPPDTAATLPSISNVKPRTPDPPTPTSTQTPTETLTPSPSPTTPAPTATWVIPTLRPLDPDAIKRLDTIPSGQEGCILPCWNGLIPGISPASDIPAFLAQFGITYSERRNTRTGDYSDLITSIGSLHELDTNLNVIRLSWQEHVEVMLLLYHSSIDLYDEASFLHPKNLIENIGIPDSAKIWIYETYGTLFIDFSEYSTATTYEIKVIENMSGESKLCLLQPKDDPLIRVVFYAESLDPLDLVATAVELEDQSVFTGLTLQEFIAELSIPGMCIPVQIPE